MVKSQAEQSEDWDKFANEFAEDGIKTMKRLIELLNSHNFKPDYITSLGLIYLGVKNLRESGVAMQSILGTIVDTDEFTDKGN